MKKILLLAAIFVTSAIFLLLPSTVQAGSCGLAFLRDEWLSVEHPTENSVRFRVNLGGAQEEFSGTIYLHIDYAADRDYLRIPITIRNDGSAVIESNEYSVDQIFNRYGQESGDGQVFHYVTLFPDETYGVITSQPCSEQFVFSTPVATSEPIPECPPTGQDCKCPGQQCLPEDTICFPEQYSCSNYDASTGFGTVNLIDTVPPIQIKYVTCQQGNIVGINTAIGCIPISTHLGLNSFLLRWATGVAGGFAFLFIIYASFLIIISHGDPKKLQAGKELLLSAIAGIVMVVFSVFLLRVIGVDILGI